MTMGQLLHCNTGFLKRHKQFVPCSVLLSSNYVIIKACSRNITGCTNLEYSKSINLQVPIRLSFESLPSFLGEQKSATCTYFVTGHCFIHYPWNFATQSPVISLQHIKLEISLFSQSLWTVILWRWSIKTIIHIKLRC